MKHTEETKQLLSELSLGKAKSAEHRAHISAGKTGKPCDTATKEKLRLAQLGKKVPRSKTLAPNEVNYLNSTRSQPLVVNLDGTYFLEKLEVYELKKFRLRGGVTATRGTYKKAASESSPRAI